MQKLISTNFPYRNRSWYQNQFSDYIETEYDIEIEWGVDKKLAINPNPIGKRNYIDMKLAFYIMLLPRLSTATRKDDPVSLSKAYWNMSIHFVIK